MVFLNVKWKLHLLKNGTKCISYISVYFQTKSVMLITIFLLVIFCCLGKIACLLIPRGNFIPPTQIILESKMSAKASGLESLKKKKRKEIQLV